MKRNYLGVARDFINEIHPDAAAVYIAGSMRRGEAFPNSDIDIVIIYKDDKLESSYRESLVYQEWMIEAFVQNVEENKIFLQKDYERGYPILCNMIKEGELIINKEGLGDMLRKKAVSIIDKGPAPLEDKIRERMVYMIADKIDDIEDDRPAHELYACLSYLYDDLANFYLRAQGKWSGGGKGLMRALKKQDPLFMEKYQNAFEVAFKDLNMNLVIELAREILAPYGGSNLDNYKAYANLQKSNK